MRSMKRTLLLWYFIIQILAYSSLWGLLYYKAHTIFYQQLDERLEETAENVRVNFEFLSDETISSESLQKILQITEEDYEQFRITDIETGTILAQSPVLEGTTSFPTSRKVQRRLLTREEYFWNTTFKNKDMRVIAQNLTIHTPAAERKILLLLGIETEDVAEPLQDVIEAAAALFALMLFLTLCAALFISHKTLRPLKIMSKDLDKITELQLDFRISQARQKEIVPLKNAINHLLERLDTAFQRERQLTADIAHELRTPLSALRSILEIALRQPRSEQEYKETVREAQEIITQTETMMENLLTLARIDSGEISMRIQPVSLHDLVMTAWHGLEHLASKKGLVLENTVPDDLVIMTDKNNLLIIINTVISNAIQYSVNGAAITIATDRREEENQITLKICNTGELIPEENLPNIFNRFWRGDAARSETGVHYGLGLSIAQSLCSLLNLSITAYNSPPDTVCFHIFPLQKQI